MAQLTTTDRTIRAQLKFASNSDHAGIFSNLDPSLNNQALVSHEVNMRNARHLSATSINAEGFELHHLPFADPDFANPAWQQSVYGPTLQAFVQDRTAAPHVVPFSSTYSMMIRETGRLVPGSATAADFIHCDQTPGSGEMYAKRTAGADIFSRFPRVQFFNVWRVMSPPPQDMPLAISDQRTVSRQDLVLSNAIEPGLTEPFENYTALYNPAQHWYYYPDLTPDDMILFKAWDSDPDGPFGCLHGAFQDPQVPDGTMPRSSIEARFLCFYEN